jgi:caffeoyl-CoA O-methyltransferase
VSAEWTAIGRRYWEKAGVAERIDLRIGPAADTLRALPKDPVFDLAFIDADKPSYGLYYELILERLRPGGVILVDNVLWMGQVVNPAATDPQTNAIRVFNDEVANDPRVDCAMLAVSDGLTLLRKR